MTEEETEYKKTLEEADEKIKEETEPMEAPSNFDIHSLLSQANLNTNKHLYNKQGEPDEKEESYKEEDVSKYMAGENELL